MNFNRKKTAAITILLALLVLPLFGQQIQGSATTVYGNSENYTFNGGSIYSDWFWEVSGGSISTQSVVGTEYRVTIQWSSVSASNSVSFYKVITLHGTPTEWLMDSKTVNTQLSVPNTTIGSPVLGCGTATVTRNSSPPNSLTYWYWQTSASGTSTAYGYGSSVTLTSTSNLYLRSRTSGGTIVWSTAQSLGSVTVPSSVIPGAPSASSSVTACSGNPITISATPGSNADMVRWYNAASGGSVLYSGNSFTTPPITAPVSYWAESYNSSSTCYSSSRTEVAIQVQTPPSIPSGISDEVIYGSGSTTITVSPEGGNNVRWYTVEQGGTSIYTGTVFTTPQLTESTTYYASSYNSTLNCESIERTIITVTVAPIIPPSSVQSEVLKVPGVTTDAGVYTVAQTNKTKQLTFFDGIRRAVQVVDVGSTPGGDDMIFTIEYNAVGMSSKTYLPYSDGTVDGTFRQTYKLDQLSFYSASNDKIANDSKPYAISVMEDSPMERLLQQGSYGNDWQPGTGHSVQMDYEFNNSTDNVRKFNTDGSSSSYYGSKKLYKVIRADEDSHVVTMFVNELYQTVLKRVQLDEVIDGVMTSYLDTYYIYDDFGREKYTISPKGVVALQGNGWSLTQTIKDQYAYQYIYDSIGRLVEKKVPGSASVYYGYDKLNRLVLMQDGLLRSTNQWLCIKYDRKGRSAMQGLYTNTVNTTRSSIQSILDGLYTASNPTYGINSWYEKRGSSLEGYTNVSFPKTNQNGSALLVLSVNYYDDYDFDNNGTADFSYVSQGLTGVSPQQGTVGESTQGRALGRATGSKRRILGTSTWLYVYAFYDKYGRVIQVRSDNHLSATKEDLTTNVYDFEGKLLTRKTFHKAGAGKTTTVINRFTYDAQGRLTQVAQNNNSASSDQVVAVYEYNELGQLVDKKLHDAGSGNYLQSVDYRYTIRGQLQSINNAQLTSDGVLNDDTNDYFGLELMYNSVESGLNNSALYSGNISAIKWKGLGSGDGQTGQRSYKYVYDKSGQLKSATYQSHGASAWDQEVGFNNESITYDHNGNIKSMKRYQEYANAAQMIDDLTYTYNSSNGNCLEKVEDATASDKGFKNGATTTQEYTYDTNGNLKSDLNKGVTNVTYNFMGKPQQVTFADGRVMNYTYDAAGAKLSMSVTVSGNTSVTDYASGFVYTDGTLSYFGSPEGRVVNNNGTLEYQYAITDHQGNTRIVFSSVAPAPNVPQTGFESDTEFDHDTENLSTQPVMNSTSGGTTSQRLIGGYNSQVGSTISLKVYPGDKVKAEVKAKYWNAISTPGDLVNFASALTGAFGVSSSSTGEMQNAFQSLNYYGGVAAGGNRENDDDSSPKGFVTILIFDKDYNFVEAAWDQLDGNYDQVGIVNNDPFDELQKEVTIEKEGYVYIFLSNENPTQVDIHFDDLKVTHTKSNIIQYNEYYPFGLQTASSWTRDNNSNNFLYNGANELNPNSGWYEMFFRGYDPALGRFLQVDPMAELAESMTAYHYSHNNPVLYNDPLGLFTWHDVQVLWDNTPENGFSTWSESGGGGTPHYYDSDGQGGYREVEGHGSTYKEGSGTGSTAYIGTNPDGSRYIRVTYVVTNTSTVSNLNPDSYRGYLELDFYDIQLTAENQHYQPSNNTPDDPNWFKTGVTVMGIFQMGTDIASHNSKPLYMGAKAWAAERALAKNVSKKLGIVGMGVTVVDAALNNKWENHHTADLIIGGVTTFLIASNPISASIIGAYFLVDFAVQVGTGKSITEHLFD